MRKSVVVTDHAFRDLDYETRMSRELDADFANFSCVTEAETIEAVRGADVAFVNFAPTGRAALEAMNPGATVIRYGIGYDNVDIAAAKELGVSVANVPDYGIETVADHAVASLLTLLRRLPSFDAAIRENGWVAPAGLGPLRSFRHTTIGLLGLGKIAQAVARRLQPFGFTVIAFDPYCPQSVQDTLGVPCVSLDELAERSHAVSLHAPSTPETYRIVSEDFLARLPESAVIVNTARGSLIDEAALLAAIQRGHVLGAALDVTDPEPLPADSPLRGAPNILFTPHAAFYDEDSLRALQQLASEEAGRALRGEDLRCRVA